MRISECVVREKIIFEHIWRLQSVFSLISSHVIMPPALVSYIARRSTNAAVGDALDAIIDCVQSTGSENGYPAEVMLRRL